MTILWVLIVVLLLAIGWLYVRNYRLELKVKVLELGQSRRIDAESKTAAALAAANQLRDKVTKLENEFGGAAVEVNKIVMRQSEFEKQREEREEREKRRRRIVAPPMAQGWG